MIRGGSWNNNANNTRSANRNNVSPGNRHNNLGFRLVLPQLSKLGGCQFAEPDNVLSHQSLISGQTVLCCAGASN